MSLPLHHESDDAYIVMPSIIIEKDAMISLVAAPSNVLQWDEKKSSLVHLSHEVCLIVCTLEIYISFVNHTGVPVVCSFQSCYQIYTSLFASNSGLPRPYHF